jgi:hypothetical protein
MITQEKLKELFNYADGVLIRKKTTGGQLQGSKAGSQRTDGYFAVKIYGKSYFLHRLVWLYHNGEFPSSELDHINGCKSDNTIENLRLSNRFENNQNIVNAQKNSNTGVRCVVYSKTHKKYRASFMVNGIRHNVGCFSDIHDANNACLIAKRKLSCSFTG